MPDPTASILIGSLAAAFIIFVCAAGLRSSRLRKSSETAAADFAWGKVSATQYQALDLVGAAAVFVIFSGFIYSSLQATEKQVPELNAEVLWVSIGFQFLIAAMVTVFAVRSTRFSVWLGLNWPSWPWALVLGTAALGFMWLVLATLKMSGYMDWMESLGVETTQETVKLLQESDDPLILGLMIFAAVIAAPICEEMVFRGYLYPVLKKFGGLWPAALSSSLVFAAAHGNLTALLPLFIFGGVLVFLYEKTGSIWAPIAAHFCFNGATVLVQMAARYYEIPISFIR